jgi:flagellar motility protein MotE (MotC chaperone)
MKRILAIVALSLLSLNAHAGLIKWVDSEGKVHYSDTAPNQDTATQAVPNFIGKDQAGTSPSYTPKSYAEREAEMKKANLIKDEAEKKKAQQKAEADTKKSNCAAARENARVLEDSPRVATYDANGERSFMDDNTRAQRLEDARKAISANCD